jgi:hypothetical protein
MRYLVLGPGRSGTTAVARAIEIAAGPQVEVFFEPRGLASVRSEASSSTVVAKILVERWLPADRQHMDWFDRRIFIARDPRDVVISRLLYQVYAMQFIHDPKKLEEFLTALRAKEQSPGEHTVQSLFDLVARLEGTDNGLALTARFHRKAVKLWRATHDTIHLLRYEDFVDGRTEDLSAYLGLAVTEHPDVAPRWQRVTRTRSHGNWKHWFTAADDELVSRTFRDYLDVFGYDDWVKPAEQIIDPEHSSEYVKRIVRLAHRRRARALRRLVGGDSRPRRETSSPSAPPLS